MSLPARAAVIEAIVCQRSPVAINTASMSSRAQDVEHVPIDHAVAGAVMAVDHLLHLLASRQLAVGDGHELRHRKLEKLAEHVAPAIPQADSAHDNPLAGSNRSVGPERAGGDDRGNGHRCAGCQRPFQNPRRDRER